MGNEYTQGVCIQGQGGEKIWVGNVYLPPAPNLSNRGIDEQVARSYVEDILGCILSQESKVICGDWNTRVGELSPTIDDIQIPRKSIGKIVNDRAPWLIEMCK
jgi:exonuclease III